MSRRVTRSQQRKQEESECGNSINGDSQSAGGSVNGSVNGVEALEDKPRKGRSPTKKQRLTAVAVVVEQPEHIEGSGDGGVEKEESKVEEKNEGEKSEEKGNNGVKINGIDKKGTHKRFDDNEEKEEEASPKIVVEAVLVEKKPENHDEVAKNSTSAEQDDSKDDSDDEDDVPEAVSLSTGRQAILARDEEIKKAREQQELSARLKRKAHDARLKEQKAASQPQPPPAKRQKFQTPSSEPTPTTSEPAPTTFLSSEPPQTHTIITANTIAFAEPLSPTGLLSPTSSTTLSFQHPPTDLLSPTSSTTLSLQHPPTDPNHPLSLFHLRNKRVPRLLPESLLDEVARVPSPPPVSKKDDKKKPLNTRKTPADFEAEEKAALEALERKKVNSTYKLPTFKKGPVHVAVLGKEEQRERDRKVMAPPGSKGVSSVKEFWMTGRKLTGGSERRAIMPVGGKSFLRK